MPSMYTSALPTFLPKSTSSSKCVATTLMLSKLDSEEGSLPVAAEEGTDDRMGVLIGRVARVEGPDLKGEGLNGCCFGGVVMDETEEALVEIGASNDDLLYGIARASARSSMQADRRSLISEPN